MNLRQYYKALKSHDWQYEYSEDPGVYDKGHKAEQALRNLATTSPAHTELFGAFYKVSKSRTLDWPPMPPPTLQWKRYSGPGVHFYRAEATNDTTNAKAIFRLEKVEIYRLDLNGSVVAYGTAQQLKDKAEEML